MKSADVKSKRYIDLGVENYGKGPKFKIGDHVGISKYRSIFAKCYLPNRSKDVFMIKIKVRIIVLRRYSISDPKGKEIVGAFYEKEFKRKGNKLYVQWKGCDNSFNSWIDDKR